MVIESVIKQAAAWVKTERCLPRSRWVSVEGKGAVYLRWMPFRGIDRIDVATISIEERFRGRGWLTELLRGLSAIPGVDCVRLENIQNPRLLRFAKSFDLAGRRRVIPSGYCGSTVDWVGVGARVGARAAELQVVQALLDRRRGVRR